MKSLAELKAIREKAKDSVIMRHENPNNIRVVVGMATCGIAAGARPVLQAFLEEVQKRGLDNVIVTPHYAPTTLEAAVRVSQMAAKNIQLCLEGHTPMGRIV